MACATDVLHHDYFPVNTCVPDDDGHKRSMKIVVDGEAGGTTAKAYRYSGNDCDDSKRVSTTDIIQGRCEKSSVGLIGFGNAVRWISTYTSGGKVEGAAIMWFPGSTTCQAKKYLPHAKAETPWPFTIRVYPREKCLLDLSFKSLGSLAPDFPNKPNHIFHRQSMKWHCNKDDTLLFELYGHGNRPPFAWRSESQTVKLPKLCWGAPVKQLTVGKTCLQYGDNSIVLATVYEKDNVHPFGCGPLKCNWEGCEMASVARGRHIGFLPLFVSAVTALFFAVHNAGY